LRSLDVVAAGPGAQWFAVLLVGRSVAAGRRAALNDADLGLVAARLRARVQQSLADAQRHGTLPVRLVARIGWTVVEPVHADRALQDLRQAIRGAAVLARVEDRRAMILASVTHELRTPLTSIIGYAEMLSSKSKSNQSKGHNFAAIIADEARRLNRLVDGLIDIGAWSNGKLKLRLQPLHVRAIALAARRAVRPIAASKRVRCLIAGDAHIVADKERLHQVFINVLDNAIRHAPASGEVDVEIRNARGGCKVIFCDSGPGFAESIKRSIGAPFAIGANGHTGLGLAIVRLLVEAHGGKISADNLKSGGGKIQIDLPSNGGEHADDQSARRAGPNRRL
jgi:signal transduction histidine kinase